MRATQSLHTWRYPVLLPTFHSIGLLVAINTSGNKDETQRSKTNGEQYKEVYRIVGKQEEMQLFGYVWSSRSFSHSLVKRTSLARKKLLLAFPCPFGVAFFKVLLMQSIKTTIWYCCFAINTLLKFKLGL